jgi:electron transfer flavoprotein beta subunit
VTGVKGVTVGDGRARLEQETAAGRDVYDVSLPAVVTVKEGLNLPRYPSVPGRLRAKRKPLETRTPSRRDAGVEKLRLKLPPGQGKQAEILGHGPEAAPAVVEVLRRAGLVA